MACNLITEEPTLIISGEFVTEQVSSVLLKQNFGHEFKNSYQVGTVMT
jgi:hypothetical protein